MVRFRQAQAVMAAWQSNMLYGKMQATLINGLHEVQLGYFKHLVHKLPSRNSIKAGPKT